MVQIAVLIFATIVSLLVIADGIMQLNKGVEGESKKSIRVSIVFSGIALILVAHNLIYFM